MTLRNDTPSPKNVPAKRRKQADKSGVKRADRSSGSRAKGSTRRSSRAPTPTVMVKPLDELGPRDGCAAVIVVAERAGGVVEHGRVGSHVIMSSLGTGGRVRGEKGGRKTAGRRRTISAKTCRALAAVGHEQRLRLLGKLLEGPATYRSLQKVTKLKAGPLYHHVNQLRLAGLILPKQRDLYELTRGGRNLVLVAMALGSLIRDTRRRPCPSPR